MTAPPVIVRPATAGDIDPWLGLRHALWPHHSREELRPEMPAMLDDPDGLVLLAIASDGRAIGMAELALRHDYVNGCDTSPVGFLEGIYVEPLVRRQGIARLLLQAAQQWALSMGCSEFASDASLDNTVSRAMHAALGFEETEQVVYFRKLLE